MPSAPSSGGLPVQRARRSRPRAALEPNPRGAFATSLPPDWGLRSRHRLCKFRLSRTACRRRAGRREGCLLQRGAHWRRRHLRSRSAALDPGRGSCAERRGARWRRRRHGRRPRRRRSAALSGRGGCAERDALRRSRPAAHDPAGRSCAEQGGAFFAQLPTAYARARPRSRRAWCFQSDRIGIGGSAGCTSGTWRARRWPQWRRPEQGLGKPVHTHAGSRTCSWGIGRQLLKASARTARRGADALGGQLPEQFIPA